MKIGIIGSGIVGRVLGTAFLKEGNKVMLGTRDILKAEVVKWKNENVKGQTGTFEQVAQFGELIVLATNGTVAADAIRLAGNNNLKGKIVIDTTNPISPEPPENGVIKYFTGPNESLMETIQSLLPETRVVKAFNSVGNALMYKPKLPGGPGSMFICGNDEGAKKKVKEILKDFGWETEDMGKIEAARAIEPLCMLWCIPGLLHNRWSHAFKLLKMPA
jgi:predicted dinucleotide-binding enzyme